MQVALIQKDTTFYDVKLIEIEFSVVESNLINIFELKNNQSSHWHVLDSEEAHKPRKIMRLEHTLHMKLLLNIALICTHTP